MYSYFTPWRGVFVFRNIILARAKQSKVKKRKEKERKNK